MFVSFAMKLLLLSAPVYYHIIPLLSSVSDLHLYLLLLSFQAPPGDASSELNHIATFFQALFQKSTSSVTHGRYEVTNEGSTIGHPENVR